MKNVSKNNAISAYQNTKLSKESFPPALMFLARETAGLKDMSEIARTYGVMELPDCTVIIAIEKILMDEAFPRQKWWEVVYVVCLLNKSHRESPQGIPYVVEMPEIISHETLVKNFGFVDGVKAWLRSKAIPEISRSLNAMLIYGNRYAMLQSGRS